MRHEKSCAKPKKNSAPPNAKWQGCARLSVMPAIAGMLMIVLSLTGCATSRKKNLTANTTGQVQQLADSLRHEVREVKTVTLPRLEVSLAIPVDSLRKLPQGATYIARKGRVTAQVGYRNDSLLVSGISDSIRSYVEYNERLVAKYQLIKEELQQMAEQQEQKEQRTNPVRIAFVAFLAGMVIGILLTIIVKLKIKREYE